MVALNRSIWQTGPKDDPRSYNVKDPSQMKAWEDSWARYLNAASTFEEILPEQHRGGGKAPAPRADLRIDNDDLNYEAWIAELDRRDDAAFEAWIAFNQPLIDLGNAVAARLIEREVAEDNYAAAEYAASRRPKPVTEDGMYRMADGTIAKVQIAVNGSGNLYAKRLVVGDREGRFEYEPGLIRKLSASDRMTADEAAEFGRLYGFCCVCGRTLTDETSIAAGIGPVCAGRM